MRKSGWVKAGEASFGLTGGPCDFEFEGGPALVQANHNLVEVMARSDGRHVGVTVVLHSDDLPPFDDDPSWEAAGEVSVTFDNPPRIGRIGHEASLNATASDSLSQLDIPAGTYRVRCSVSGARAAFERRNRGREVEDTPRDATALMEQFRFDLAPQDAETPPTTLKMLYPSAGY